MWLNRQGVASSTAIIKRDYVKVNRPAGARKGVQYANTPKSVRRRAILKLHYRWFLVSEGATSRIGATPPDAIYRESAVVQEFEYFESLLEYHGAESTPICYIKPPIRLLPRKKKKKKPRRMLFRVQVSHTLRQRTRGTSLGCCLSIVRVVLFPPNVSCAGDWWWYQIFGFDAFAIRGQHCSQISAFVRWVFRKDRLAPSFENGECLDCSGMLVDTVTVISPETGNAHDWYLIALEHSHNLGEIYLRGKQIRTSRG